MGRDGKESAGAWTWPPHERRGSSRPPAWPKSRHRSAARRAARECTARDRPKGPTATGAGGGGEVWRTREKSGGAGGGVNRRAVAGSQVAARRAPSRGVENVRLGLGGVVQGRRGKRYSSVEAMAGSQKSGAATNGRRRPAAVTVLGTVSGVNGRGNETVAVVLPPLAPPHRHGVPVVDGSSGAESVEGACTPPHHPPIRRLGS